MNAKATQVRSHTNIISTILFLLHQCFKLCCVFGYVDKTGLMYTCVFILLRLSGERELGVALNRTYTNVLPVSLPKFTGTYADLLIIVCQYHVIPCHTK
jgi:hypothetical protein